MILTSKNCFGFLFLFGTQKHFSEFQLVLSARSGDLQFTNFRVLVGQEDNCAPFWAHCKGKMCGWNKVKTSHLLSHTHFIVITLAVKTKRLLDLTQLLFVAAREKNKQECFCVPAQSVMVLRQLLSTLQWPGEASLRPNYKGPRSPSLMRVSDAASHKLLSRD